MHDDIKDDSYVRNSTTAENDSCLSGSHFSIFIDNPETVTDNDGPIKIKMKWRGTRSRTSIDQKILEALICRLYFNLSLGGCLKHNSEIKGFIEIKLDGHTYQSHPSYWGEKPWYDWALVMWDHESDPYPAQICMMLDLSDAHFMYKAELDRFRNSPL